MILQFPNGTVVTVRSIAAPEKIGPQLAKARAAVRSLEACIARYEATAARIEASAALDEVAVCA